MAFLLCLLPEDFANFMKVASIVLSTADRDLGMRDLATPMAPQSMSSIAPGWLMSKLVMKVTNHVRYLSKLIIK